MTTVGLATHSNRRPMWRTTALAVPLLLGLGAAPASAAAFEPAEPPALEDAPLDGPPPPALEETIPQPPAADPIDGQWVHTRQYGWVWMPYAQEYTFVPDGGDPVMYVYGPELGWRWVVAPWVFGWGPAPYWGARGRSYFVWYTQPWFTPRVIVHRDYYDRGYYYRSGWNPHRHYRVVRRRDPGRREVHIHRHSAPREVHIHRHPGRREVHIHRDRSRRETHLRRHAAPEHRDRGRYDAREHRDHHRREMHLRRHAAPEHRDRGRYDARAYRDRDRRDAFFTRDRGRRESYVPRDRGRRESYAPRDRGRREARARH